LFAQRGTRLALAILIASVIALPGAAGGASGASPVGGARYVGEDDPLAPVARAALQVSRDGRRLSASGKGSYLRPGRCGVSSVRIAVRSSRSVVVQRDGSFHLIRRIRGATLRLSGRFGSSQVARIVYRLTTRAAGGGCDSRTRHLTLHRSGPPPFSGCRSQPARNLAQGPTGRLFVQARVLGSKARVDRGDGFRLGGDGYEPLEFAYGCLFETNRRFRLGLYFYPEDPSDSPSLEHFRLAGPYAAYWFSLFNESENTNEIETFDLRSGQKLHSIDLHSSGNSSVTDLEVNGETSSIGWIETPVTAGPDRRPTQVEVMDRSGRRVLDRSPLIQPRSLSFEGSTLSWLKAGVKQSAPVD
jgi:hypothetical protein